MINVSPIATYTQEDISPVSDYLWFKMYELSGTTFSDDTGNATAITIHGTLPGAVFDNLGWFTPNGTDNDAYGTADTFVKDIMRFDTMSTGQLLISFDHLYDGGVTSNEAFFWWGRNSASGYGLFINSSSQFVMQVAGDTGLNDTTTFAGFALSAAHGAQRNNILLDIQGQGDGDATVDIYVNGILEVSNTITLAGAGVGGSSDTSGDGLTLMARRSAAATTDMKMSGAAGNARMSNFFAMQRSVIDATFAATVNKEFYDKRGDLPTVLDGK